MDNYKPLTRVIVPTITFFDEEGHIDLPANELLIRHVIANRADSLFLMGSTGEGRYFIDKPEEKQKYLELAKQTVEKYQQSPLPIIIGAYGEDPDQAIADANMCLNIIPDAGLVIPPPADRQLELEEQPAFFEPIFNAISAPIYLYNNPDNFGGTTIELEVIEQLKKFPNFVGIKDSSGSDDQKKIYLQTLTDSFTVSCGKEGILAKFLTFVSTEQRDLVGIIPSISNIVNTCSKIFDFGLAGQDDDMLAMQDELNAFREKIYDSAVNKGKAQRGTKISFAHLYKEYLSEIPTTVYPKLYREIEPETIQSICDQTDQLVESGYITKLDL